MKKNLLLMMLGLVCLSLFSCVGSNQKQQQALGNLDIKKPVPPQSNGVVRVMFVGNSHTKHHVSLPYLLESLCVENGKEIETDALIVLGASIDGIMEESKNEAEQLFSKTDNDGNYYDYIILQERSIVAVTQLEQYIKNCKSVVDKALINSPGTAVYVYELMSPVEYSEAEFKGYQKDALINAAEVAKSLNNAGVLRIGSAIANAYAGEEGYVPFVEEKDMLRYGFHLINDGGFLCGVLMYQALFNEFPRIPGQLPLCTGTGDDDVINMLDVNTTISNKDALLKIAARY